MLNKNMEIMGKHDEGCHKKKVNVYFIYRYINI